MVTYTWKDKVRVGIVKIEQDYYNIKAQAMNMDPTKMINYQILQHGRIVWHK